MHLSGTPCKKSTKKKKSTFDFFIFFHFYESSGKKKLITCGKKIKSFILIDVGETRKKRFLDLF
jgi:hypothetical protein